MKASHKLHATRRSFRCSFHLINILAESNLMSCLCPKCFFSEKEGYGYRIFARALLFSVLNGGLVSYKYAGREMIEAIPKPNFWRAPTDNDCGSLMQMRYAQWKIASMYASQRITEKACMVRPMLRRQRFTKTAWRLLLPTSCQLRLPVNAVLPMR